MTPKKKPEPQEGIWTDASSKAFYENVSALADKLKSKSPEDPKDYRRDPHARVPEVGYSLLFEEELHIADHFAFLAHAVPDDNTCVSAVALEEIREPPGLVVRLASNKTPKQNVVQGMERILNILEEHAEAGMNRETYKLRLFTEVVNLSQQRIHRRIWSKFWKKGKPINPKTPLHKRIKRNLNSVWTLTSDNSEEALSLHADLIKLRILLKQVDAGSPDKQTELLKEALIQSHVVSNQGTSKSLSDCLQRLNFQQTAIQQTEVLEIDKLSNYWQLCDDMIRLSRQPKTRQLCRNIKLEVCTAPPTRIPIGSSQRCYVHGEVQLILFYEQSPVSPPPRAIGSSKSACLLCDLFVRCHGKFGVSDSHMKFYPQWTIPNCEWAVDRQSDVLKGIISAMVREMEAFRSQEFYCDNNSAESKLRILSLPQASIVSSDATLRAPQTSRLVTPYISIQHDSSSSTSSACLLESKDSLMVPEMVHNFSKLPVVLQIHAWTQSCTLDAGKIEFFIDMNDVWIGTLQISDHNCEEEEEDCIDAKALEYRDEKCIIVGDNGHKAQFDIHNSRRNCVRVIMTWASLPNPKMEEPR